MGEFREPKYLNEDKDVPTQRIRCPIHGFIRYSENERKVIDHRLFRRLRFIRQLALTEFVYPGATHSRFEHSLGVMEVASRAFDSLASRHGATMESRFADIPDFADKPLAKARQGIRLAALVHDIGHPPFSHAAEDVFKVSLGHEALSVRIILSDGIDGLKDLLDGLFWNGCSAMVARIIQRKLPPQLKILSDLISGEMDADRTDYLLRDSLHCGVDYGRFDYRRMIECLETWENPAGGLEIAIHRAGIHTFEALILARYQMNVQVYYHRLRRIYDHYLREYLRSLGQGAFNSAEKVLAENDITLLSKIFEDHARGKGERNKWAARIVNRNHHRVVHDTGVAARGLEIKKSLQVFEHLRTIFPGTDFVHDICERNRPVGIHKLQKPDDPYEKDSIWIEMRVISRDRKIRTVGQESQVLSSIPREFQVGRVFADTTSSSDAMHRAIEEEADRKWNEL